MDTRATAKPYSERREEQERTQGSVHRPAVATLTAAQRNLQMLCAANPVVDTVFSIPQRSTAMYCVHLRTLRATWPQDLASRLAPNGKSKLDMRDSSWSKYSGNVLAHATRYNFW